MAATETRPRLRFHVLAVPHTITRKDYSACAFTQKVLKFCKMMKARGHTVYHYGHRDSEVDATERIDVMDNSILEKAYGHYDWKREFFKHHTGDLVNQTFNQRAIAAIESRKKPNDFLLMFWGVGHKPVAEAHKNLIAVEPGIGCFNPPAAKFNVFESYAVMHYIYGTLKQEKPGWYDAVIPNYFDLADFEYRETPGDYFLYLGRIVPSKGIEIAVKVTEAIGAKLKIAGQGDFKKQLGFDPPAHVEILGYVEPKARDDLLRGAKALLAPTHYVEPFGGVMVEALLCGTPVITSDWGAFSENNLHGVTGYRCRNMDQFVWAARNIDSISRKACRDWAAANFSVERIAEMYEEYFWSLVDVANGKGFYQINEGRRQLDWLDRKYPCTQ
jgi:glycosyltransferase involved in cell wall biosynthesis